ncbi:multifunctional oxoglutarate decarboxylase/oxoglutarate dehydrogenase thiamine pyrophosphate-binding subunit/dihydrolipoyllysine-residue succinyltransferase subunit [Dactylosporangium aurantiacum]|uniref:Multifunctional oxoglutarate decarboxylase/oxoglutarate dehydrogenase thiamine pyrophosphate-binding subunit/dihydrolipoyllysine-residue succinyltransferase subunit n=2 Tax=Dactylosporangium aurantiacum TaxID=35754 RepID=A0A9Q9IGJ0_9ACTN|nr:multifunctional oxoglutarate decarboxylase/oxoglutarate dehydrogenase thiamine pyrophosphate-binding subunit/dihydrolipoyllysine-residue succinyltransferase subunit [Dactylosporangium aurantiacum]MDG6104807.1 multifunctional oxoglutarate decarboxylase/oxoglutarate dehydrogenase thiamine pyrophosphate-binding subunit/dihydrolipoyllysine-residue succinyltransferase subunit [Dactylosporangium aurantiacum]UWZ55637.1 multifunctional oxoglutarate decarboxylase/oxoglutarate dehydrogenase thiamine pyr
MSTQATNSQENPLAGFGPNEWIVEDMYQRYLADPASVDPAWHDFFADYKPSGDGAEASSAAPAEAAEPASVTTPAAAAPKAAAPAAPPAPAATPTAAASPAASAPAAAAPAPAVAKPVQKAVPATRPAPAKQAPATPGGAKQVPLRGVAARIVQNMDASLEVPTATSVRAVPAKLLSDNRIVINNHLARGRGGKVSFTHLIGFAMVRALAAHPEMNNAFAEVDGKPHLVQPEHVNLGIAIDLAKPDGSRSLVVPSIKAADTMDFRQFWSAYEEIVRRARRNELTMDDYAGTTVSLTNPGGIGTVHSMPRLMAGQGTIIGVGAMEYPAPYAGMSDETLADLGISKILTLTSTYDHRIIQGAQSGEFLKVMHELLLGEHGFYDQIFTALRIPYEPVRWVRDVARTSEGQIDKAARVVELIHAYRVRGHLMADTDPLEFRIRRHPDLDVLEHGLTLWDLDRVFPVGGFAGKQKMKLRAVLGVLRDSYCRRVGVEYMHIMDPEERRWIAERVEKPYEKPDTAEQKHILNRLNAAEAFETFLQTKYVGQRRFSLEGGESLIPLLDEILQNSAEGGLDEVVIGMAHRGRLNVLANIVGKPYEKIFSEFEGHLDLKSAHGSGDVKYHLGMTGKFTHPDGEHATTVSVVANPSHLEAVNPVLEGIVRAKQDSIDLKLEGYTVLPLLIHGDAAFAGQGVVAETLNLSQLRGYRTGGTVHVVVNNQVGFTTAPEYSRSSLYSTDVARMIQAPIFHVNGDDPEAVVRVARLAFEYRQAFNKDVVIDLVCYRRRGHNEGDDPSMTNPLMYAIIDQKRSVRKIYTEELIGRGDIPITEAEALLKDYHEQLETVFKATRDASSNPASRLTRLREPEPEPVVETAIDASVLRAIGEAHVKLPDGFTPHKRVQQLLDRRAKMAAAGDIDWGFGEIIAFGSLVNQGVTVRLSGQDSRRGTFVQRHASIVDAETGADYMPVSSLIKDNAKLFVYDSLLSEFAAMGFEYGYSVENPDALVMWEAQFGDFVNGAQSIVDEFISSGEVKWGQRTAVTLLLPHSHEGQGPDHTSGRLERYLQLCAEDNMRVAVPTTPANHFHLLRRQALSPKKKPLVVFTPKSLLRHRLCVSPVEDFTSGTFATVLGDPGIQGNAVDKAGVKRVLLCSGKVFYDLLQARTERGITDTAIIRVEQLYPMPVEELREALAQFPNAEDFAWVQEEPANQGAWSFIALNLLEHLQGVGLRRISRPAAAAPAVGSTKLHDAEQHALIEAALPKR